MSGNIVNILNIPINSGLYDSLLTQISNFARTIGQPKLVFTPNPEFIIEANKNLEFRNILAAADINIPDGIGLIVWSRLLGWGIRQRIAGADMVNSLLKIGEVENWTIGIVGARRGVESEINLLIAKLISKYPKIKFINLDSKIGEADNTIGYNVIFACQGMVKQESWIWENRNRYKAGLMMGIGGSLDFITGFTKRAPQGLRKLGLEWLWRVIQRPSHLKRAIRAVVGFSWLAVNSN